MSEFVDAGMELTGVLDDEEELQQWLEQAFEECGWTAIREVSPHRSNFSADLIVNHDRYGWFGIETKYIRRGAGSGGAHQMAKAHHQIVQQYRGKKYIGNRINLWAVCPYIRYFNTEDGGEYYEQRNEIAHTKTFFDLSGIGWIGLDTYALSMSFVESQGYGRVPVGKLAQSEKVQQNRSRYRNSVERWRRECDMDRIRESVRRKTEKIHYGNQIFGRQTNV
jgi:hypothetical protein